MSTVPLGQKIKNFRKRAGLSQFQLEQAIDAAPGSISRIEAGQTNPTKETLVKLHSVLQLSDKELNDLLGIVRQKPSTREVEEAITEITPAFQAPGTLAYLLDDMWNIYAASSEMINALGLTPTQLENLYGKNLLEIILDPKYGIRNSFDEDYIVEVAGLEFARYLSENRVEAAEVDLPHNLKDLDQVIQYAENVSSELALAGARYSYLVFNGLKIRFNHARELLKCNSRFRTIQLFNPQPYE